jgi:hypothetical protein
MFWGKSISLHRQVPTFFLREMGFTGEQVHEDLNAIPACASSGIAGKALTHLVFPASKIPGRASERNLLA